MKLNSKRSETESGTQLAAYATKMIRVSARNFEPFMKLNRSDLVVDYLASFRFLPGFVPVATRFHSGNRPV